MDIPVSASEMTGKAQQAVAAQTHNDPSLRPPVAVVPVPKSQGPKNEIDEGGKSPKKVSSRRATVKGKTANSRKTGARTPAFVVNLRHQDSDSPHLARTKESREQDVSLEPGPSQETAPEKGRGPDEAVYPESHRGDRAVPPGMKESSSDSQTPINGPGGPYSVTLDGLASNISSLPDSPEETARKMDMVRRSVLMAGERGESDHLVAIAAAMTSAGARWEIVQEQRGKAAETSFPGQEAREELRSREAAREAEEAEKEKEKEEHKELPSLPHPSRYAVPLSDQASFYTPRFSEPARTQFNTKALDSKSGLGDNTPEKAGSPALQREMTLARQSFKRATAPAQEPRPLIQVRV